MGGPRSLAEAQRRALDRLRGVPGIERFYLAGGTAVAFHLHHRASADLDLFSVAPDADLDALARAALRAIPEATVLERSDATLKLRVDGIPVDVVNYPYPPLVPPAPGPAQFPVAGPLDLAVMKLAAIARRGLRRDFWDLFALLEGGLDLVDVGSAFLRRFGRSEADLYHVMRALTWFDDAERAPVFPPGLTRAKWEAIKEHFEREAPRLLGR